MQPLWLKPGTFPPLGLKPRGFHALKRYCCDAIGAEIQRPIVRQGADGTRGA